MRIAFLVSVVILTACSRVSPSTPGPAKVDLLSDATCAAPCLLGITPGTTTEAEVRALIQQGDRLSACSDHDNTSIGGVRWIECNSVIMTVDGGIITQIGFDPEGLSLRRAIEVLGPPDAIDTFVTTRPDTPFRCRMTMRFDKVRAQIGLMEQGGRDFAASPESPVATVTYYDVPKYKHLMTLIAGGWKGYGVYPARVP